MISDNSIRVGGTEEMENSIVHLIRMIRPLLDWVMAKSPFVYLHEGQPLFDETNNSRIAYGLKFAENMEAPDSPLYGVIYQSDCIDYQ